MVRPKGALRISFSIGAITFAEGEAEAINVRLNPRATKLLIRFQAGNPLSDEDLKTLQQAIESATIEVRMLRKK